MPLNWPPWSIIILVIYACFHCIFYLLVFFVSVCWPVHKKMSSYVVLYQKHVRDIPCCNFFFSTKFTRNYFQVQGHFGQRCLSLLWREVRSDQRGRLALYWQQLLPAQVPSNQSDWLLPKWGFHSIRWSKFKDDGIVEIVRGLEAAHNLSS